MKREGNSRQGCLFVGYLKNDVFNLKEVTDVKNCDKLKMDIPINFHMQVSDSKLFKYYYLKKNTHTYTYIHTHIYIYIHLITLFYKITTIYG